MAGKASYEESIRLCYQVSVALFSIYGAIYAVLTFVQLATLSTILPGGTLPTVVISVTITKFAEQFYNYMTKGSKYLWDGVKDFEDKPKDVLPKKNNEYAVFPFISFFGIVLYYFAVDIALKTKTIPSEQLLVVLTGEFELLAVFQAVLWQILIASSVLMPVSGLIGFYFILKHNWFPENICKGCEETVKPRQDYCPNCGSEINSTKTKMEHLKQLLGGSSKENTGSENPE